MRSRSLFASLVVVTVALIAALGWWWASEGRSPVVKAGTQLATKNVAKASPAVIPVTTLPVVTKPQAQAAESNLNPEPIVAFKDWSKRYLAAKPEERTKLEPEGIKLAQARRPALKQLIKDDAKSALENAVPMVVRQQLPLSILAFLEKRVNRWAGVTVYQGVPAPGEPLPSKSLTHRIASVGDEGAFNMYPTGDLPKKPNAQPNEADPNLLSWTRFPLNGISIDRELAANNEPVRVMEVGEVPNQEKEKVTVCPISGLTTANEDQTSQPVTQEQSVVETPDQTIYLCGGYHRAPLQEVLLYGEGATGGPVVLTGALPAPPTPAIGQLKVLYIPMTFLDQKAVLPTESKSYEVMRNVADYYSKSSFGKLTTLTTVTPQVTIPRTQAWMIQRDSSNGGEVDGLSQEMNLAREEARKLGFDHTDYDVTVLRMIGGPRATGGWGGGGFVIVYGDSVGVTAHEIGHTFGLAHANFWDTAGTSAIGPGANAEYGNSYDVMGGGNVPTDQYNAAAKVQVKWMPPSYVQNVTTSGLYRIYAFDQPTLDPRNRYAMTITKDSQRTYWGEVRQLYNGSSSRPWADKGMLLGWKFPGQGGNNIQLIDTTPGSPYGKEDAAIALGQTFGDTEAGIFMTTMNVSTTTPKFVDVLVNIGDFSTNNAPTLTLAASTNVIPVSSTVTFTATANDVDGDALAYQWQHWGDTNVKIVSPNSPTITRSFPTAGNYVVSCTVSDMKGGTSTRTTHITVGNGGSKFTISGRVTSGGVGVPNVLLTANGTNPTITDSNGDYIIANLSANTYSITPALYGYTFSETFNNSVTVGPNFTGANFESDVLPSVSLTAVDATASEGAGGNTATLRLTRTGDTSVPLVVNVSPQTGTALGSDFTLNPALGTGSQGFSTFTIPDGASTLDVILTATTDGITEGPETVIYTLGAGAGYLVAPNAGKVTVTLDDAVSPLPKICVLATTDTTDEGTGTPAVFTFKSTMAPTTTDLIVNYTVSGTAASGTDFTALSGSVSIPVGSTSATVNVTPINDSLVEPLETVIVTVSTNAAYLIEPTINTATVSLLDDDTNVVSVSASDASAKEVNLSTPGNVADTGTFTIRRTGDLTSALTVYYSIAGNPSTGVPALHGVDFDALPGVLQIPAGASAASVTITPRWDDLGETPEQVVLQLGAGPTDYRLGLPHSSTVTIADGAGNLPYVEIVSEGAGGMTEGGSNGIVRFSLKGSVTGTVAVPFALTGTATLTTDYTVTLPVTTPASTFDAGTGTGTIVLSTNATTANGADLTLVPVNDSALEDLESITCTLTASGAFTTYGPTSKAELWLRDDDRPTVWMDAQIGSGGTVVDRLTEGSTATPQRFYFSRTGAITAALTVNFSLNGSATPGTDYNVTTGGTGAVVFDNATRLGSVTIPAGASGASVPLTQVQDAIFEGTEYITAHLETGSYGRTPDTTITIMDNDTAATTVSFDSPNGSALENAGTVNIPVSLNAPATVATTVDYVVESASKVGTTTANASVALPYWVRVVKTAAVHTLHLSTDGTTWRQMGSRTMSANATSFVAGLVASSALNGSSTTATFDNVSITGVDAGGTVSATPTFGSTGATSPASTSSEAGGVFTLNAGGSGLSTTGTTDNACLVSYAVTNSSNCTITARVTGVSGNNAAYGGVTIRNSTAANNAHVSMVLEKTGLSRQVWRLSATANAATLATNPILRPYWVKVQRVGDDFSSWGSSDGTTWTAVGSVRTIPMGLDVQAGLAVCARSDGQLATATFDNVTFNGVPATGLTGRTIGYVDAQGSDSLASGVYTVSGSGNLIGNTEDECHFVATTKVGDFTLVARVLSQSGGASNAQAGVMVRASHQRSALAFYTGMVANALTESMGRLTSTNSTFGTGVDYTLPTVQTLTFAIGEQNKVIPLTITDDTLPEPPESVYLVLRNPIACGFGTNVAHTFVIDDNDAVSTLPTVGFAAFSTTLNEEPGGTAYVDVSLGAASTSSVTVDYSFSDGIATAGLDYTGTSGTLTFAPGETVKSVPVQILDDSLSDDDEDFAITLTNPTGATLNDSDAAAVFINDTDVPVVTIVATDASAAEAGLDPGVFTISRTGPTTSALTVSLSRSGSATNGTDYTSISATTNFSAIIPAGSASTTITITPISDSGNEGNETVGLSFMTSPGVYAIGVNGSATVTIADDDRPTLSIAATDAIASETAGNTATFTITRSVLTSGTFAVTFTIAGTATNGTDYATIAGFTFAAGETTKVITVTPVNDLLTEGDEAVVLQISNSNATITGDGFAIATIQDNDFPPSVSITSPTASGALVPSGQGIIVSATASDDGSPAALTTTWSQVSGPGTATFATPNALTSAVTFSADGVYVLRITATDTQFTVNAQVTVIIGSAIAPTDWIAQDMSPSTQLRGQSAKVGSSYVLSGTGGGHGIVVSTNPTTVYGDAAHVMARSITGDGSIVARLTTLNGAAATPLAGVTIRDTLNRSSNRAVLAFTNSNGSNTGTLRFATRTTAGAADNTAVTQTVTLPIWVKLDRVSATSLITASYSSDGTNWTTLGTPTAITMLDDTTQMGLVATGNSSTNACQATFDNVTLTPAPSGNALIAENFGTAPPTMPTFAFDGTTYTIGGSGGMDSNGAFYGWQYQGDVMITAKLASASSSALSAKSGIMIRESMDDTAAYSHVGRITSGSFAGYIWRNVAGGNGGGVPAFTQTTRWMRLIRQGNRITAFHAADAAGSPGTWTQLGSARTIILPTNVLVGFAVDNSGGAAGVLNTCTFTNLSIVPLNKAPAISIATSSDLSPVSLNGTVLDDDFPLPVSLTTQWSQLTGPSPLTFANAAQPTTTATFTGSGLFGVRLAADDSSIQSFKDSTFTAYGSPFAKWLTTTTTGNGNNTLAEATLDADGDGLMNLLEYAIGTNGTVTNTNPQVVTLAPVSTDKYLRLSIPKNPAATDVTFIVEACSDLVSWSSTGLVIETNTSTQLTVRDNVPVAPNNRRFMRVRVVRP